MPEPNMSRPAAISKPRALCLLTACALGLLVTAGARAHDFWIEPSSFSPSPGQAVAVRLVVGEHFVGDAVARPDPADLHRFVLADAHSSASVTLPGRVGADPAGLLRLARPGSYVIGFHGKPIVIELPAEKFNAYLEQEGLQTVLAARAEHEQLQQAGREIFSRCAKSLLSVGPAAGDEGQPADRVLGFTLELVAEAKPDRLRDGEALPVRLLHEGRPLAGALVVALHRDDPRHKIELRSDAEGRVLLPLSRSGPWLVMAVHMRPAPAGSGADRESLWASLSFVSGGVH